MSSFGVNPAQSIAGMNNAERLASKDIEKAKAGTGRVRGRRRQDEVELSGGAEPAEPIRNLKDPTQEEAKQDRKGKARLTTPPPGKRLDVKG